MLSFKILSIKIFQLKFKIFHQNVCTYPKEVKSICLALQLQTIIFFYIPFHNFKKGQNFF